MELELLPEIALPDFGSDQPDADEGRGRGREVDKALRTSPGATGAGGDHARGAGRSRRGEGRGADGRLSSAGSTAVEFPGGTGNDIEVEIGGDGLHPRLQEQLEGMKPGETRTIEVTFPAEYGAPDLAGKAAAFEVTSRS